MALVALLLAWGSVVAALESGFQIETMVSGLTESVYLAELPDGRMLVGTKGGTIFIFDPQTASPTAVPYLEVTDIDTTGERGLTSFALDPEFATNGWIYVYYTHGVTQHNRISRFTHSENSASVASEQLIWEDPQPAKDCCHYGGGFGFGPDGKLYLTAGEEFDGAQAQDLTQAGGKIIRINKDGTIPADNPFADGPGGNLDEIWAYGLRNPYRAHWDMVEGRLYIGEVGGNINETAREDIHVGRAGANFGWPYCEGQCTDPAYDDPIYDYAHTTAGGAVTLGTVYRDSQFPAKYQGVLFFSDYVQQWVRYLTFNADGSVASVNTLGDSIGRIVHLITGSDGALYFADIRGVVKRIAYTAGNQPPAINSLLYDANPGPAPVSVAFNVDATDPEGDPLTYRWFLGDGTELAGQSVVYEYTQNGVYQVRVEVSDGQQATLSEIVEVRVGNPPVATITAPADGLLFRAGQQITFAGSGSDPDEPLADANFSWTILFGHNTHTHPTLTDYIGSEGSFDINTTGHDYHSDTRYEITLTVTDSDGLTATDSVTIYPDKVNLQLGTSPTQAMLLLDGIAVQAPLTYDTLIGFKHVVTAQAQCIDGTQYSFDSWSDGGAAQHEITIPDSDITLTANFVATGTCTGLPEIGKVLHLESDSGVTTGDEGLVQGWADQSGQGNHLTGAGDPRLVPGALNGQALIDFDGAGDKLERVGGLTNFPAANTDRTVFMVANYRGTGYGGLAFGNNACNQTFGIVVEKSGYLMLQGWCNDFTAPALGTGTGWMVQSAMLQASQVTHYRDGAAIDSRAHSFNTVLDTLVLGAEIDSNPYVDMQVAAVLVYNRALTETERSFVTNYLQQKYLEGGSVNQPPVATDDSAAVASGGTVMIDVLANDGDADGTLDPASVTLVTSPSLGAVSIDPGTGAITYAHGGGVGTSDTLQYQVADDQGAVSNTATVTIAISDGQNQPPMAVDDSASVMQGESVAINVLANDSDPDGALDPGSIVIVSQPAAGSVSVDTITGELTYTHDGSSVASDAFDYTVADSAGLTAEPATVTISVETVESTVSVTSPAPDSLLQGPSVTVSYAIAGTAHDHLELSLDGQLQHIVTTGSGSYTFDSVTPGEQTIVATLVDANHAPLPGTPASVPILVTDAAGTPLALDDEASVASGDQVLIQVLANDVDIDGTVDPASVVIVSQPQQGSVTVDASSGGILYQHLGGGAGQDSFTYQVSDDGGLTATAATVTVAIGSTVPTSGLVLHLEADTGVTIDGGAVTGWSDQSGQGNHLIAAGDPQWFATALNGHAIVDFDGAGDKLERTTTLNGFPADNADRTVILVANYESPGYGGFGFGNNDCNQMFGTSVSRTGYLMLQGWCRSSDFHTTVAGTGTGWLIQSAVLNQGQLAHFRDGVVIDSRNHSYATALTRLVLGAELDSNPFLDMQVAAVLVYNRALTATEHEQLIAQLQNKYLNSGGGNLAPTAADDSASVAAGGSVEVPILANDSDADGELDLASVQLVQTPAHGTASVDAAGTLTYLNDGSGSSDTIGYTVSDTAGAVSNTATVTIAISGNANQSPVAQNDEATVTSSGSVAIDVLANDSDADGTLDPASVTVLTAPAAGYTTLDAGTGVVTYFHGGGAETSDSFSYDVQDDAGAASNAATVAVTVTSVTSGLPSAGLVLHVEADSGVSTVAGTGVVTGLADRSGADNHLSGAGDPLLVAGALNGQPVIDFDGVGDKLERIAALAGFPTGAGDRTVFLLANYRSVGYGGFGFGTDACNQMFGLSVSKTGNLMVQGWCRASDFHSNTPGTGSGWLVQSAVLSGNALQHFRNGALIDSRTNAFDTVLTRLVLGAEIDSAPYLDMQAAAAIVYNRALSDAERIAVEDYLRIKYAVY